MIELVIFAFGLFVSSLVGLAVWQVGRIEQTRDDAEQSGRVPAIVPLRETTKLRRTG
jgi:hypothetical protein